MCGRLSLFTPEEVLAERFDAEPVEPLVPRYNVAPGDDLAVVRNDAPDRIDRLEWGLVPRWADGSFEGLINARAETIAEKPSFREAYEERRCLVLADGFYDWAEERGGKQPYRVARVDDEPFAMAGLWERREGNGDARGTVTVVTTEPNAVVEPIHHRMPAVLEPDHEERWLSGDPDDAGALLDPYPDDELRAYPVSTAVNDPANDSPAVVEEVDPDVQTGLGEFS